MSRRTSSNPESWPIVWRVVFPACGNNGRDMVMLESPDAAEARSRYLGTRRGGYPVRLERVSCGPLPGNFEDRRAEWLAPVKGQGNSLNLSDPAKSRSNKPAEAGLLSAFCLSKLNLPAPIYKAIGSRGIEGSSDNVYSFSGEYPGHRTGTV